MPTIQERFEQFHIDNPHIFNLIVEYTIKARNRGFMHYSINTVFEAIRWHMDVVTYDENSPQFKLNNNYRSRYVRLLEEHYPQFEGFYFTRQLKAA